MPFVKSTTDKRITFCIEGNISIGKCTFVKKIVEDTVLLRDLVEIVPEPVSNGWMLVQIISIFGCFLC